MTDDLISRQAAIDALEITDWYHQDKNLKMVHGANDKEHQAWYKAEDVYKAIDSVPSAQLEEVIPHRNYKYLWDYWSAQPKTGRWIANDDYDGEVYYTCSRCEEPWVTIDGTPQENRMNYCPHCGAKMEGV